MEASMAVRRTVVEVPVPEADTLARSLQTRYGPEVAIREPCDGASFAHVSIAGVFPPPDELAPDLVSVLAAACAGVERFSYALRELRSFPGGVMYLAPDPDGPFRDLMRRCAQAVEPGSSGPPEGRSVPHVTVVYGAGSPERSQAVEAEVLPLLPIRAEGVEAHLVFLEPGRRSLVARFPLGRRATGGTEAV